MSAILSVPQISSAHPLRTRPRTALLASSDSNFRQRLNTTLTGLRWQVREAETGAQAWAEAETSIPEAVVIDSWLPDLDLAEFMRDFRLSFPSVDVIDAAGATACDGPRSPHRQEIFYALRTSMNVDTVAWNAAPDLGDGLPGNGAGKPPVWQTGEAIARLPQLTPEALPVDARPRPILVSSAPPAKREQIVADRLPELVGNAETMLDVSRRIRLVAPRSTPVLIQGPTGSGKELVAEALHRLSTRSRKPFIAINCAAIPEALLEAELFGHTRGAFTGAVQDASVASSPPTGARFFLTRLARCRWHCSPSCCALWSAASCSASATTRH